MSRAACAPAWPRVGSPQPPYCERALARPISPASSVGSTAASTSWKGAEASAAAAATAALGGLPATPCTPVLSLSPRGGAAAAWRTPLARARPALHHWTPVATPRTSPRASPQPQPRPAKSAAAGASDLPAFAAAAGFSQPALGAQQAQQPTPPEVATRRGSLESSSSSVPGQPVTFFLEGKADQQYGRIRGVSSNGLFTVDLVGGGRRASLDAVTPCSELEVRKAEQSLAAIPTGPLRDAPASLGAAAADPPRFAPQPRGRSVESTIRSSDVCGLGCPVSFLADGGRTRCFGRVRSVSCDGSLVVDVINGRRAVGVERAEPCDEADLQRQALRAGTFRAGSRDAYAQLGSAATASTAGAAETSVGGASANGALTSPRQKRFDLVQGTPVYFSERSTLERKYGRVRSQSFGRSPRKLGGPQVSYTIDLVCGGLKVGVSEEEVKTCSEDELSREAVRAQSKKCFVKTGTDPYAPYATRNTFLRDGGVTAPAVCAPVSVGLAGASSLRGVAIARVKR
eukprot:TRINITY_DN8530_c0_g1_i1.p1 TRINITY_DN8530_c0_g1~~TRINITY_DN8530_c0_g1_i1.p1  ORF type:complete len:567 (-),score=96.71 TRINITY_DN8530_c0_g1_i1:293-1837(-)